MSLNPSNLAAETAKKVSNGGGTTGLLQSGEQAANVAAVATTGATNSTPYGFTTAAQADALVAAVNSLLAACKAAGVMVAD